jgi:hypothetical protein
LAIRSSPQSGFSLAMRRINWRSSSGIGGRPGLDLTRQNRRQPARCQRQTRRDVDAHRRDATLLKQRKLPAEK